MMALHGVLLLVALQPGFDAHLILSARIAHLDFGDGLSRFNRLFYDYFPPSAAKPRSKAWWKAFGS